MAFRKSAGDFSVIMKRKENNYAFIDSQNVNLGIQKLGWKLDHRKFEVYLAEKYCVKKAYMFIGFVALEIHMQCSRYFFCQWGIMRCNNA